MNATRIGKAGRMKVAAAALLTLLLAGCNAAQTGALYGAGLGSIIGASTNRHRSGENALIGAGIGAVAGYLFGNEVDKANAGYGNYGYPAYSQPSHVDVYYQQSYYGGHSHHAPSYRGGYRGNYHHGHCDW